PGSPNTLRFSRFDAATHAWSRVRTIVASKDVTTSSGDFPQLAIDGRGHVYAVWTDGHGGALSTESADGGATWTEPHSWTRDGHEVEKFSFVTLADGRALAAWLDGRAKKTGTTTQGLYARI